MRHFTRRAALAFALLLTVAAPSALANGTAQNLKLRLALLDLPATVAPGQSMRGTLKLDNLTTEYANVSLSFALVTPLGPLPIRSGAVNLAPAASKTKRSSFTVTQEAKPGAYQLIITATTGEQTLTVTHDFTVSPR